MAAPDVTAIKDAASDLIAAVSAAAFECGEWDRNESDETYEAVFARSEEAERKLLDFIIGLATTA